MFKSQLEPSAENFVETQIFVENIFDTVKKAREAKAARSLAESKLAHYDYSFDFSPSKRKKTRKNAKCKTPKNGKTKLSTPKKKPRKPRTPKDSAEKKKKTPTTPKTPRKYTKRTKVKPQNDIDDEEAAFILSSISQRSFDSFYNRFNGTTQVVNKIQIPLETSTVVPSPVSQQTPITPKKSEPNHLTAYHHVLLDHNYWIVEPPPPPTPAPTTPTTSTIVVTNEPPQDKVNNESQNSMNLLLTVASHELSSPCTQNSTNSIKVEVNNNKLPLLDVNCDTPKLSSMSDDNAVKKRWLRQATTECSTPSPTVTPPETSPNDMKAPLKKRRIVMEMEDNNEIKIGVCSETESSKLDQTTCFESNNFKNNVEAIKFNNNFVNNSALLKCESSESVNINLREIHEKMELEFGRQYKNEQNVMVVKEEPQSVIQSPISHQLHAVKNNLTYGIQMNSPVDVNAIYGRSQPENLIKIDHQKNIVGSEGKLPHTQTFDEKLIKIEPHDYKANNVNLVDVKFNDKIHQPYGIKNETSEPIQQVIKPEQIKLESPVADGKLQQILDGKIQKIFYNNSQYFVDQQVDQKYGQFQPNQMSVIHNLETIQKQNHIVIHTGADNNLDGFPKIHQVSPTKINQLKGLSSPTKIQISPTRTYEIYTKNPHENIAESLLKLQQESPVKLLHMSPTKVIHSPNYQVAQALTFETSSDHGYQKKADEKLKKTQKASKVKVKAPKVKKTPIKAKKAQQKTKKLKTPKSPSKSKKKIDKSLIKNFGNLEDVPLKIRQNLEIPAKSKDIDAKLLPIVGLIPPFDTKFQQIGGKIMQVEVNQSPIEVKNHIQHEVKANNHVNDSKLLDVLNKVHGSEQTDTNHSAKRTVSESSTGSSRTSTCSSRYSISSVNADDFPIHTVEHPKKALKKLKFDDQDDQHLNTLTNFQTIKDSYAEKISRRTTSESSSVSSRTLSCHSPDNTLNTSFGDVGTVETSMDISNADRSPVVVVKAKVDLASSAPTKASNVDLASSEGSKTVLTSSAASKVVLTPSTVPKVHLTPSTVPKVDQTPSVVLKVDQTPSTVPKTTTSPVAQPKAPPKSSAQPKSAQSQSTVSSDVKLSNSSSESQQNIIATTTVTKVNKPETIHDPACLDSTAIVSKAVEKSLKVPSEEHNSIASQPKSRKSSISSLKLSSDNMEVKIQDKELPPSNNESKLIPDSQKVAEKSSEIMDTTVCITTQPKLEDDIITTVIEPPSILKSLSDGIAPIKTIPFKSTLETLESIIDLKPEKVVEQQVASILEKVIPKTLKTVEIEIPETEPIESDNETMDDEDDTPYREKVEEFHKDTLEKLMEANKRFCHVNNPFRHSVSYDGRDSRRYQRDNRGYDYDDHRKPLKMSVSFESHQQYPSHHNYYQRSISEVFNDPRKERWYENRNYGSFHYDKIHHREPITTTYSMYRAQKASQMEGRWNNRSNYEYPQEPQQKINNYVAEKPVQMAPQPTTPTVINSYRPIQPEPISRSEPALLTVSPQAEALKSATLDPFGGFLKDTKINVTSPVVVLPKTKTASHDPRLNPLLVQDVKKEESATPKKKLSLDQYRKRKSLTSVSQVSPSDENMPSISVSITESPSPTLSPAFDPSIAAAAATG